MVILWALVKTSIEFLFNLKDYILQVLVVQLKCKGYGYWKNRQNCKSFKTNWICDDRRCNGSLIMRRELVIKETHERDVWFNSQFLTSEKLLNHLMKFHLWNLKSICAWNYFVTAMFVSGLFVLFVSRFQIFQQNLDKFWWNLWKYIIDHLLYSVYCPGHPNVHPVNSHSTRRLSTECCGSLSNSVR